MAGRQQDLGNPAVFQRIYAEHHRAVFRTAYDVVRDTAVAEDVAQDVFLALWRRPERFDARRGELGAYLRLMARSRALDAWRSARSGHRAQDRLADRARADRTHGEDVCVEVEARERAATVRGAMRELPAAQREALALVYWGDLGAGEVAARTSVPLGTAKSRVRLGLARLRAELATQPTAA